MAISCDTSDLATEGRCFCFDRRLQDAVEIYLLCTWAGGGVPAETGIVLGNPDEGWYFGDPGAGWGFGIP